MLRPDDTRARLSQAGLNPDDYTPAAVHDIEDEIRGIYPGGTRPPMCRFRKIAERHRSDQ